ncbi:MAG: D-glycerate dehydrogenase [Alphaproteobacteria bacterium]|nr:D-glycerate dehydrogenase [Alphaproteobacteria bacterium]
MTDRPRLRVLCTVEFPPRIMAPFEQAFDVVRGTPQDARQVAPDVVLCSGGGIRLPGDVIAAFPDTVKAIATYSVGYDHVDLEAARARGIAVFNTPGVLGDAVADAAMLLMLGAARRATEAIAMIRNGEWKGWTPAQLNGIELAGKTLGILGMGDIGNKVARRARAFGMEVAYTNRRERSDAGDARFVPDPHELIAQSDVLLLAWPSTEETRGFIDAAALDRAKRSLILVNVGRGDLVVDDDLIAALQSGRIFAAGLDVFNNEPNLDRRFLDLPNAFLLPHVGSSTWEARLAMAMLLVDALHLWQQGGSPANRLV